MRSWACVLVLIACCELSAQNPPVSPHKNPQPGPSASGDYLADAGAILPDGMPNCSFYRMRMTTNRRKIYYGVTFYNELDTLEVLLNEVGPYVDYVILVENVRTFTFKRKRLTFSEHQFEARYAGFIDKIRHIVIDEYDLSTCANCTFDPWAVEYFQRDQIRRGTWDMEDEDVLIWGDVDEILPGHVTDALHYCRWGSAELQPFRFTTTLYYYNFRCRMNVRWFQPMAAEGHLLPHMGLADLREFYGEMESYDSTGLHPMLYGWHISFFGSVDEMQNKIASYSHQELNNDEVNNADGLKRRSEWCTDFANRPTIFSYPYRDGEMRVLPRFVFDNPERFENWLPVSQMPEGIHVALSHHESKPAVITVLSPQQDEVLRPGSVTISLLGPKVPGTALRVFVGDTAVSESFHGAAHGSIQLHRPGNYLLMVLLVDYFWETLLHTVHSRFVIGKPDHDYDNDPNVHPFNATRMKEVEALAIKGVRGGAGHA